MRLRTAAWLIVGVVFVLTVSACSSAGFDPTGNYSGTASQGGSTFPTTASITSTSTANQWAFSITSGGGTDTGTCTHNPAGSAGNLTCTFNYSSTGTVVFTGTLSNGTYAGTFTDTNAAGGTFTLTRS